MKTEPTDIDLGARFVEERAAQSNDNPPDEGDEMPE